MLNGAIMSATLGSLVECTSFGTVKQIIEINRETEIEDIAYYNGKFYFAVLTQKPNRRHQVDIYVGDPNYDFENSINMQRLKNLDYLGLGGGKMKGPIIMPNNISVQVVDTKGSAHHAVKMSTGNSMEFGMSDNRTILLGTSIGYFDANKNKTFRILTEDDMSDTGTVLSKTTADSSYLKKKGNQSIENGSILAKYGFMSYEDTTQMDSWSDNNANRLIVKRVAQSNGAPQNGVLLEYSQGDGRWRGRLFIADNGNDGVYYGGFSNGTNTGWHKMYGERQQNRITFANGAELWVE